MKTLLVATDFSNASRSAANYAVNLAAALNAKVVLLNVYPYPIPAADVTVAVNEQELKQASIRQLKDEVDKLAKEPMVEIEMRSEQGTTSDVIPSVATDINASWIVAGMKGSSKMVRKIFGGVAFALSHHSSVPLILVPEHAQFKKPEVIALASDITEQTDMHILDPLTELGEKFHSLMYIVRVITKGMDEVVERLLRPGRLTWHLRELHPSYELLTDNDVAHAINYFVSEHEVDMVAMIAQEHNLLERIFVKSDIKEMIIQTHVPLIILPGKVIGTSHTEKLEGMHRKV